MTTTTDIIERVKAQVKAQDEEAARLFSQLVDEVARGTITDPATMADRLHACRRSIDDLDRELKKLRKMRECAALVKTLPDLAAKRAGITKDIQDWRTHWKKDYQALSAVTSDESAPDDERYRARMELRRMQETESTDWKVCSDPLRVIDRDIQAANTAERELFQLVPQALRDAVHAAQRTYFEAEKRYKAAESFADTHLQDETPHQRRRFLASRLEVPAIRTNETAYASAQKALREFEDRLADYECREELQADFQAASEALEAAKRAVIDYPDQYGAI